MHSASKCYLCLSTIKHYDSILCTDCFCKIQQYKWALCARCGISNCSGCTCLGAFENIFSLYSYHDVLANVLDLAKNKQNLNSQKLFFDIFFVSAKRFLVQKLNEKRYDYVLLSPLRKERVFSSSWHTNIFFEKVLFFISENKLILYELNVISPHFLSKKKQQSILPIEKRIQNHQNFKRMKIHIPNTNLYNQNQHAIDSLSQCADSSQKQNILLLDDVLTTGKTALLLKEVCEPFFKACSWDFLSLLRTPQK